MDSMSRLVYHRNEEGNFPMLENRSNSSRAKGFVRPNFKVLLVLTLMALAVNSRRLAAEEHVVSVGELRQQVLSAQQVRQNQIRDVHELLGVDAVQESLRSAGLDAKQLKNAVSLLDNDELARLAGEKGRKGDGALLTHLFPTR